jgi:hypothetical protein
MPTCPSCGRPVALVRPRCLYCGEALSAESLAAAEAARAEALAPSPVASLSPIPASADHEPRVLLVMEAAAATPAALAGGLGLSLYEAGQRILRGGYQLLKILEPLAAQQETERLAAHGLAVVTLPEAAVREARLPRAATSASAEKDGLRFRLEQGTAHLARGQVLLIVKGPITREYQSSSPEVASGMSSGRGLRRVRTATLDAGYLFHLHLRDDPRPLEIDPGSFDFGPAGRAESSLRKIAALVEPVADGARVDDHFRRLPPALAPAAPARGPLAAAEALRTSSGATPVLDNARQFREYSAWRGTLERQLSARVRLAKGP